MELVKSSVTAPDPRDETVERNGEVNFVVSTGAHHWAGNF